MSILPNKPTFFDAFIKPTLTLKEREPSRNNIKYTAIAGHSITAIGVIINSSLALINLVCALSISPSRGMVFITRGTAALVCYELHILADNVASIFNSQAASQSGNTLKNVSGFTSELTKNTFIVSLLNPTIEKLLNRDSISFTKDT